MLSTNRRTPVRLRGRPHRWVALAAAGALGASALVGATASVASAAPVAVTDATFAWTVSDEANAGAFNGQCNWLSAGQSDSTEATYVATDGDVTVVKLNSSDQYVPISTWADRCKDKDGNNANTVNGPTARRLGQKVVYTGGTGTVDPVTGEATISWTGTFSINFYGTLVPFWFTDPTLTIDASGTGTVTADMGGYASDMSDPDVRHPLPAVEDVVIATLASVASANSTGFTTTPVYEGVEVEIPPEPEPGWEQGAQNRSNPGWGSWPLPFVDFQFQTGLGSYWYSSGSSVDARKAPDPFTVTYNLDAPPPGAQQTIVATVPEPTGPGELIWSIDGDQVVDLGTAADKGTYLQATGELDPIALTDTRTGGPEWSISGQVSDFSGGLSGKHLGWTPKIIVAGAGAEAGDAVASGIVSGDGLSVPSPLATAAEGHAAGSAQIGADLDLRLPVETDPGSYSATLTITALG